MINTIERGLVYCLIPARSGSKGVVDKNIKDLGGKPLISWTIDTAKGCKSIDKIIVSTDSNSYARISRECGAEVPFLRPSRISGDSSTDLEWIQHALGFFAESDKYSIPEFLVHLRPTTPLRNADVVEEAIEYFKQDIQTTALRSVHEMPESAYKMMEVDDDGLLRSVGGRDYNLDASNEARQTFAKTFCPNGYVDVLRTDFILSENKIHGNRVRGFLTEIVDEVDCEQDFNRIAYTVRSRLSKD